MQKKTTRHFHKTTKTKKTKQILLPKHEKKISIHGIKIFGVKKAPENNSHIAIVITDDNPSFQTFFVKDHQIDKTDKLIYKIDIADQIVKTISIEITTPD